MKLPKNAKRVFKGDIFEIWQWSQKLYDGSMATFERVIRPGSVNIIPIFKDKILIANEEQPDRPLGKNIISGRLEKGEDPLAGAKRELKEESGYTSSNWELYKTYNSSNKIIWERYFYIARDCKKTDEPNLDPGEKIEIVSMNFKDFIALVSAENNKDKDFMSDILRMQLTKNGLQNFKNFLFNQ